MPGGGKRRLVGGTLTELLAASPALGKGEKSERRLDAAAAKYLHLDACCTQPSPEPWVGVDRFATAWSCGKHRGKDGSKRALRGEQGVWFWVAPSGA